jgi:hydroxymethylglutaryl-CoA reductase (NADPH)
MKPQPAIPRDRDNDYSAEQAARRRQFLTAQTGATLDHLGGAAPDPALTRGNIENLTGFAQVPLGFAGPLHVRGEYADGQFYIPLATTEGTLVASYNRGMKLLNASGGVLCTVSGDAMQRAPVFEFDNARLARDFAEWIPLQMESLRREAEATTRHGRLATVECYPTNNTCFVRFAFTTGDAAGQNMVTRATEAACHWITSAFPGVRHFFLEANMATDKKASMINTLRGRGKRVTAEATIPRALMVEHVRVTPEQIAHHSRVGNLGTLLSGAVNNGLHSANAIAAMFIATGQDVANLAESSTAMLHCEITPEKDLYISITLPSLIVATHGGGTGLPTQRECLGVLDCVGAGKARKLAEIVAATVLAGELSLVCAISSMDWVVSHEQMGRNR